MAKRGVFLTELKMGTATDRDDGQWELLEDLVYSSRVAGQDIRVPKGFRTDLASVPRIPIVYELCGDTASEAAVIHDYLYTIRILSRRTADAVLLEACATTKVPLWRRYMIWAGVRLFGWTHWK